MNRRDDFTLSGIGVALITPFQPDKSVDYGGLARLVDYQIDNGVDFLVVLGTTGETPTLSEEEKNEICRVVVKQNAGRVPLVLGLGGNNTAALVQRLHNDDLTGFSAILSVVPYYNKPSQSGLYAHYAALAEASPLPIILYNVPGRTGVNMEASTTLRLARDFKNIIGIKEASGNIEQITNIIQNKPEGFEVISGDDGITFTLMQHGASGVISVVGNAFPQEFGTMVHHCRRNDFEKARPIHAQFTELLSLLFIDGNPAGVKCTLHARGFCHNVLRLPLVAASAETEEKIHRHVRNMTSQS